MIKEENRRLLMDLGAAEHMLKQTQAKLFNYDEQMQYESHPNRQEQSMYKVTSESCHASSNGLFPPPTAPGSRPRCTRLFTKASIHLFARYSKTRKPDLLDPPSPSLVGLLLPS
jgi:hypothetical protein